MDYDSFALANRLLPGLLYGTLFLFLCLYALWKNPRGSQTRIMNVQAQPITSTLVKPSGSQTQPQAPAQAQPTRLAQAQLPQQQGTLPFVIVRHPPSDSLHDEERLFMDFSESQASLIA